MSVSKTLLGLGLVVLFAFAGTANSHAAGTVPRFDHIFVIVEENHELGQIFGNANAPTFNYLAQTFGLATNYYGVTHPSEGNYVALVGGNFYGIQDDNPYTTHLSSNPGLPDQLEAANLTWKGYFQGMPSAGYLGTCYPSDAQCLYASRHNGFLNFSHVQGNPTELAKLVPDTVLTQDLAANTVPNYSFIVPDNCHNMHGIGDCPDDTANIQIADSYLSATVTAIMNSSTWAQGRNAIVVTFDEGSTGLGCCDANPGGGKVTTIVATNHQAGPLQDPTPYNHYSLVATIEKAFGMACIQYTCDTANVPSMDFLFDGAGSFNWTQIPGAAQALGVGADGTAFVIGSDAVGPSGDFGIYKLTSGLFQAFPGAGVKVAVDPQGYPWVLNAAHGIYHWNGAAFIQVPGAALDIAVGSEGSVWVIGTSGGIYRLVNGAFTQVPGAALKLAVGSDGNPWVINASSGIYHLVNGAFQQTPGAAREIGAGPNGQTWVIGVNSLGGGNFGIYHLVNANFIGVSGAATRIVAGGPQGLPWVLNAAQGIYQGAFSSSFLTAPLRTMSAAPKALGSSSQAPAPAVSTPAPPKVTSAPVPGNKR